MISILVVGNGSASYDEHDFYINNHTGNFLIKLKKEFEGIVFCEYIGKKFNRDSNLQNFALYENKIPFLKIESKNIFYKVFSIINLFLFKKKAKLYHLFFPGTLGLAFAILCIIFNRQFSIYLRGELNFENKIIKYILKKALFILTVSSVFVNKLKEINNNVSQIKPMISITKKDLFYKREFRKSVITNFLFVGRVEKQKGIYEIIDLASKLDDNKFNYVFHIVGGGEILELLKNNQLKGEISNNIKFHGLISDTNKLTNLYKYSDIFILPTHFEGFPRVLYEAMSHQLPIITTMVGGISAIMIDEYNCIGVEAKNVKMLYHKVIRLMNDDRLRKYIGQNAVTTMEHIFEKDLISHEKLISKYL